MNLILSALAFITLFATTSAEAQRRRDRRPMPQPQARACFYENDFFQGRSFCLRRGENVMNLANSGFNDRISSAQIPHGMTVTVFKDSFFRGPSLRLNGREMSFTRYGRFWNDQASSIMVR